ncbi:hypothetical protein [Streptomyces beijiangensis]|uniref:Glycoprotein n=1 Tax=Streptomyces beijiangensis TaxID=163361 RepID=A0A939JJP5_9ACTN|nr:hypothetical protein [Streptomyces beijiangensis]MBO0516798.1 hypothetical protein [Streptomyces beijiangensis]
MPVVGRMAAVVLLLLAGCVGFPSGVAGAADTAGNGLPVTVTLTSLTPSVPVAGGTVTVKGNVKNTAATAVTGVQVGVRMGEGKPLSGRAGIGEVAGRGKPVSADGEEISGHLDDVGDVAAGKSADFSLAVPVSVLGMSKAGVYEFAVDAQGTADGADAAGTVGITRTFLPWFPTPSSAEATSVSAVWPLTATPHINAWSMANGDSGEAVFSDDSLADDLGDSGRLDAAVRAADDLPVTWVVDPELLAEASAMSDGYRVASSPDDSGQQAVQDNTAGSGRSAASSWLKRLKSAVSGGDVVSLAYGDPDLASVAHHGSGVDGLTALVKQAGSDGAAQVASALGVTPEAEVAWPADEVVDTGIVRLVKSLGGSAVVTSSAQVSGTAPVQATSAGTTALVADSTLGDVLSADSGQAVIQQRVLAETLAVTLASPSDRAGLFVVPPRQVSADAVKALGAALGAAQDAGWVKGVTLDQLRTEMPAPAGQATVPAVSAYPASEAADEISAAQLQSVVDQKGRLTTLLPLLTAPDRVEQQTRAAMASGLSTAWRADQTKGDAYREGLADSITASLGAVHLVQKSKVTLSGDSGKLQVSVDNGLQQKAQGLVLGLTAQAPMLEIGDVPDLSLTAAAVSTVSVPVAARSNGQAQVTAQLYRSDTGEAWGDPVTFTVEVTSIQTGALWVVGGGLVLMLIAVARIAWVRRRKATRGFGATPRRR